MYLKNAFKAVSLRFLVETLHPRVFSSQSRKPVTVSESRFDKQALEGQMFFLSCKYEKKSVKVSLLEAIVFVLNPLIPGKYKVRYLVRYLARSVGLISSPPELQRSRLRLLPLL